MAEKTRVYYEFRQINTDQVLILDRPAQVTFQAFGLALGQKVIINNSYTLISRLESLDLLSGIYNSELILNNNLNEIDVTNYQIRFTGTSILLVVIIKYYENPN